MRRRQNNSTQFEPIKKLFRPKIIATALTVASLCTVGQSSATELEVTHWWTSGGEAAAVKVLADTFNAGGDSWVDGAIAGSADSALPVIISRIIGGNPMHATQLNHGRQAEELVEAGLMLDLTELAIKENWADVVRPSSLLDSCTQEGKIYCVPINIHSFQWMWVSLNAYKKAGIDAPNDWNEFVASAPKLREAGITPLAVGAQTWQTNAMFGVIRLGLGGMDLFKKIDVERDIKVVRGPEMQAIWTAFGDARNLDDDNNSILNWNDATRQVINGTHAAQIMGDWAQGEFQIAGQTAGKEYDCLPGLGLAPVLDTGGDAFYFPKQDDPAKTAAQLRMASMMISKAVQVEFNLKKGSLPVRSDVELKDANECMKKGLAILKTPDNIVQAGTQLFDADTTGQMNDLLAEFWTNPKMSVEDAYDAWTNIIMDAQ